MNDSFGYESSGTVNGKTNKSCRGLPLYSQLVQTVTQRTEADTQQFSGLILVSFAAIKGFFQVGAFDFLHDGIQRHPAGNFVQVKAAVLKSLNPATFVK